MIPELNFEEKVNYIKNHFDENTPVKTFTAHPFIKWVGGKRSIINELLQRIPKQYSSYHEPFLGGGALFFALNPKEAFLSDINFYLIITYTAIRDNVEEVICNLTMIRANLCENLLILTKNGLSSENNNVSF